MGLSFFGPLIPTKAHHDFDQRRMVLWLIAKYMHELISFYIILGSVFPFSLEGVHSQCFLLETISCVQTQ